MKSPIDLERVEKLTAQAKAILANHHPMEQGAVLIQLVSLWLAGHSPALREDTWTLFCQHLKGMLEIDVQQFDALHAEIAASLDRKARSN